MYNEADSGEKGKRQNLEKFPRGTGPIVHYDPNQTSSKQLYTANYNIDHYYSSIVERPPAPLPRPNLQEPVPLVLPSGSDDYLEPVPLSLSSQPDDYLQPVSRIAQTYEHMNLKDTRNRRVCENGAGNHDKDDYERIYNELDEVQCSA